MLSLRLASAAVAVPFLFFVAYFGEKGTPGATVYGIVITLATALGAWEARGMLLAAGRSPVDPVLLGFSTFLPFQAWFLVNRTNGEPAFANDGVILGLAIIVSLVLPMRRRSLDNVLLDWATSLAFAIYLGGLMAFFAPLRDRPHGAYWVACTVGFSFICDSTAYFIGRAIGRTPLAPAISPKKSVEGAVGGLIASAVAGAVWAVVSQQMGWGAGYSPLLLGGFGAAIALATIFGDLSESLLKRQTGVKDSGLLIPGHGGILDRMDSLLFCAPVATIYLMAFHV